MENRKYYLACISAYVMWGVFSIALRAMDGYLPSTIMFYRILISVGILFVFFAFVKRKMFSDNLKKLRQLPKKEQWMTAGRLTIGGTLLAINWLVFIHVINNVSIKTASFSYLICPVLTAALGYVFLKENLSRVQWIAVTICGLSCLMIGKESLEEAGYSLVIAASYAFYLIVQRKSRQPDKLVAMFFQLFAALIIITPFYGILVPDTPTDSLFYWGAASIAVFFTLLPLSLQLFALDGLKSATVGILMYINPLMNFVIAMLLYGETIGLYQAVGYLLILFAVVLFNLNFIKQLLRPSLKI